MTDLRAATPGRFGPYGGRYVPETLMAALEELDRVHEAAKRDPSFWTELNALLKDYVGRDRKSTRLNSSHGYISYAVFCLKKKKKQIKLYGHDHQSTTAT